jgi:luciferase family oxidoreductase group 1
MGDSGESFPQDVLELQSYFRPVQPGQAVRAVPGAGRHVPLWLLGSSLFSAQLAAELGLRFAFASHFAPAYMQSAIDIYRSRFKPSAQLQKPYVAVGVNLFAADDDATARRLFTSLQLQFLNLVRGVPGQLSPPVDSMDGLWSPDEKSHIDRSLSCSAVGSPDTVAAQLQAIEESTGADELMLTALMYDHAARLHSFEIASRLRAA